ncbi:hypothetical protein ACXR0O_12095 [Verrucomicrobiota bacterium sgz303538]
MNFVEIPSQNGPLLLNLDHVTSVQVQAASGSGKALVIGIRGTSEVQHIPCPEAEQVYDFLSDQLRPTSFVTKRSGPVGFAIGSGQS